MAVNAERFNGLFDQLESGIPEEETHPLERLCSTREGWESLLKSFAEDPRRSTDNAVEIATARMRFNYRNCTELRTEEEWIGLGARMMRGLSSEMGIRQKRRLTPIEMRKTGRKESIQVDIVYPTECVTSIPPDHFHGFTPQFALNPDDARFIAVGDNPPESTYDEYVEERRRVFFSAIEYVEVESLTDIASYIMWLRYGGEGFEIPEVPPHHSEDELREILRREVMSAAKVCSSIDGNLRHSRITAQAHERNRMRAEDRQRQRGVRATRHDDPLPRRERPEVRIERVVDPQPHASTQRPDHVLTPAEVRAATAAVLYGPKRGPQQNSFRRPGDTGGGDR